MNSSSELGTLSPTTLSSGSLPPDKPQLLSVENAQEPGASPLFASQLKRTTHTSVRCKIKLRKKGGTIIPLAGVESGSGEVRATLSWAEGTHRAMKEECLPLPMSRSYTRLQNLTRSSTLSLLAKTTRPSVRLPGTPAKHVLVEDFQKHAFWRTVSSLGILTCGLTQQPCHVSWFGVNNVKVF